MIAALALICSVGAGQQEAVGSLIRTPERGWAISIKGPPGLLADPSLIQASLQSIGGDSSSLSPTIQIGSSNVVASPTGTAVLPVEITRHSGPGFVRLKLGGIAQVSTSGRVSEVALRSDGASAYLPIDMEAPGAAPGQRFLCLATGGIALQSADGSSIPSEATWWKELRLERYERIGGNRFIAGFRLQGWTDEVVLRGTGSLASHPGLAPIVWDPAVRALRTKYMGKPVYAYGGLAFQPAPPDFQNFSIGAGRPLRVRSILRLYGSNRRVRYDGDPHESRGTPSFDCDHPLVVLIDSPTSFDSSSSGFGIWVAAEDWHVERLLSTLSGVSQHPEWTPEQALEVSEGRLEIGADAPMAAWIAGWPPEPGSKRELLDKGVWRFAGRVDGLEEIRFKDRKITSIRRKTGL